jgi:hypothetical protein
MAWKPTRTFWIIDGLILGAAMIYSGYKVATRVMPLPVKQVQKKLSAEEQTRVYYRQYPEGYLRISKESWRYEEHQRKAFHSLILTNTSKVAYNEIELLFRYQDASKKFIKTHNVKLRETAKPGGTINIRDLEIDGVPPEALSVVASVAKAEAQK